MASYRLLALTAAVLVGVPGARAETATMGGLVASSIIALVLLLLIVAMVIMAFYWRKFLHKMYLSRGKMRVPRKIKSEVKSDVIPLEDKRSVQNGGLPPLGIHRQTHYHPDDWFQSVNSKPDYTYMPEPPRPVPARTAPGPMPVATIDFDEEEEPVIVADVSPSGEIGNRSPQNQTGNQTPGTDVFVPNDVTTRQQNLTPAESQENPEESTGTENVKRTTLKEWRTAQQIIDPETTDLHTNTRPSSGTYLRATRPTASQYSRASGNDIIITPLVPPAKKTQSMDDVEAMMVFDGDDEDGRPLPAWGQQDILF